MTRPATAATVIWIAAVAAGCGAHQPAAGPSAGKGYAPATARTSPPPTTTASPAPPTPSVVVPPRPRPRYEGHVVDRLTTSDRVVALTFDAGANNAGVARILRVLDRTHTRATFFLTARWARTYPADARAIAARYPIGNHTVDHPDLTGLTLLAARRQVTAAQRRLIAVAGRDPRPLFRFPYGASDADRINLVNDLGYAAIGWTVDTLGWQGTSGGRSAESVRARILAGLQPGEIVLMHVGSNPTDASTLDAAALRAVIVAIRDRGYTFTALPRYIAARN